MMVTLFYSKSPNLPSCPQRYVGDLLYSNHTVTCRNDHIDQSADRRRSNVAVSLIVFVFGSFSCWLGGQLSFSQAAVQHYWLHPAPLHLLTRLMRITGIFDCLDSCHVST